MFGLSTDLAYFHPEMKTYINVRNLSCRTDVVGVTGRNISVQSLIHHQRCCCITQLNPRLRSSTADPDFVCAFLTDRYGGSWRFILRNRLLRGDGNWSCTGVCVCVCVQTAAVSKSSPVERARRWEAAERDGSVATRDGPSPRRLPMVSRTARLSLHRTMIHIRPSAADSPATNHRSSHQLRCI